MVMAVCISRICSFFISALLFAAALFSAEGTHLKTVAADHDCGEVQYFSDMVDTYRIIMSQDQICPNGTYFECTVKFKYLDSYRTRKSRPRSLICVDFARIRLTGASTKLDITAGSSIPKVLTSLKYPSIKEKMSTRKCYGNYRTVRLTFSTECDTSDLPLRYYFASWIYVYSQLSSRKPVYHIDGTCKLEGMLRPDTEMTIRSFIWQDTVAEPNDQKCSLLVKSDNYKNTNFTYSFCPKWNFKHIFCGLSVYYRGATVVGIFDYNRFKIGSCYRVGAELIMNACIHIKRREIVIIEVRRNRSIMDKYPILDGALIFEVKAHRKVERKTYNYGVYAADSVGNVKKHHEVSETANIEESETFENFFYSYLLLPICILSACCFACICTYCDSESKQQQPQNGAVTGEDGERNVGTACPGTSTAVEPLVSSQRSPAAPSQQSSTLQTNDDTSGEVSDNDKFVAPPPAYVDVAFGPLSPGNRSSITSLSAPSQTTEDSSDYSAPPPPVLDAVPAAPPSYHELFPSND